MLVDHAEEHTIGLILDHGYWAGLTLYPQTKVSPSAPSTSSNPWSGADLHRRRCDWGPSDSMAVPAFALALRRRGHGDDLGARIVFDNPVGFLSGSRHFRESGWVTHAA